MWCPFLEGGDELQLGWSKTGMKVILQNISTDLSLMGDVSLSDLFTGWHKHCFTWKSGGSYKVCCFIKY